MLAGPGRPSKACNTCKTQKARCSGDRPICQRCSRLRRRCSYGSETPDLQQNPWPSQITGAADSQPPSKSTAAPEANHSSSHHAGQFRNYSPSSPTLLLTSLVEEHYLGIPLSLVLNLVEVYWTYVGNASLVLHKKSFLEGIVAGTACTHVVVSVCAVASIFYRDKDDRATLKEHGFMTDWAERAGKLVFQEAENVAEDNLVTFWTLAFFWHSQGSWRRAYIHRGNSAQAAHVLGLGVEKPSFKDPWVSELRSELGRRRFWACYLMHCYASEPFSEPQPGGSIKKLAMPWPDDDFDIGVSNCPRVCLESGQSNGSIYCEMIRAWTFWSSVNALIKTTESNNIRVAAIHALDDQISAWWTSLPSCFHLTPSNMTEIPQHILPNLLHLYIIYHQCLCALHSSIVPLFCWSIGDDSRCSARQLSAQIAFENACTASALLDSFLSTFPKPVALPSFAAYAAYCGCAIQIPFMWCSNLIVRERTRANVRANIRMIHTLAPYWKFCSLLEIRVRRLHRYYERNQIIIEDEPRHIDPMKLTSFKLNAPHARESILGHTQILWTNGDGYAKAGEENTDLGIEEGCDVQAVVATLNNQGDLMPSDLQNQSRSPAEDQFRPRTPIIQQGYYPIEPQTLDVFHPWAYPIMLDMFPNNEDFPFSEDGAAGTVDSHWWERGM